MSFETMIGSIFFWAIWILIPLLMDGSIAMRHIMFAWAALFRERRAAAREGAREAVPPQGYYPQVSVVVPVYNSADTLFTCLNSIAGQTYPADRLEVFLVDNGSTDGSFAVFNEFSDKHPGLLLRWIKIDEPGKAKALNAGFFVGDSELLINLDSDARMESNVVMETVKKMQEPDIAAATGVIMVDIDQIAKRGFFNLVQTCEAFEYLESFLIGRRYQSYHNTLFTLAGAFSCFKRQDLLRTFLYDESTLSEDTKLTFELRRQNSQKKISIIEEARVYVSPIESMKRLYAQRVRWQRGELDVIAGYMEHYKGGFFKLARSFAARLLFVDHTMIFPRVVWTVLVPFLIFLGYPLSLIVMANVLVYLIYLFIDLNFMLIIYFHIDRHYRKFITENIWKIILLPIYRFIIFWFRAAAAIHAVTELARWSVDSPVARTMAALAGMGKKAHK